MLRNILSPAGLHSRAVIAALGGLALLGGCATVEGAGGSPSFASASAGTARLPAAKRVPRPRLRSLEYRLNPALSVVGADRAYAKGATGKGVTIAVIDTGVSGARPDLRPNLSPRSIDLISVRRGSGADERHGGDVAGLLASALDGSGAVGIAYRAEILSIRADIDGSCARQCAVRGTDLARGIDYALANGARIIAVALVGGHRLPSTEAALRRAAEAGAVVVAAAGNDSGAQPGWPARYAADPRYSGGIVAAGATTWQGTLAPWSNRAGATMANYVAAPGQNVIVNCDERFCNLVSGTSYSVAYVAGALALVMERHPELSGREAAELLLQGARDSGPKGTDPVSGRGILDVARTFRLADAAAEARSTG